MRIELKRNTLIIVPETDQDKAFIEDTLGLKTNSDKIGLSRVNDVTLGFQSTSEYVLKIDKP